MCLVYNNNMKKGKKVFMTSLIIISVVIIVFLSLVLTFNIVYTKSVVKGSSMESTFFDGDRVYINKYEKGNKGDIVVVGTHDLQNWNHMLEGRYIVKRLIATAGDTVSIKNVESGVYEVLVNNQLVMKKHIDGIAPSYVNFVDYVNRNIEDTTRIQDGNVIVKDGEVFLLGDNWQISYDSTTVGPVSATAMIGRVDIIVPSNQNIFWGTIKGVFKMWF